MILICLLFICTFFCTFNFKCLFESESDCRIKAHHVVRNAIQFMFWLCAAAFYKYLADNNQVVWALNCSWVSYNVYFLQGIFWLSMCSDPFICHYDSEQRSACVHIKLPNTGLYLWAYMATKEKSIYNLGS